LRKQAGRKLLNDRPLEKRGELKNKMCQAGDFPYGTEWLDFRFAGVGAEGEPKREKVKRNSIKSGQRSTIKNSTRRRPIKTAVTSRKITAHTWSKNRVRSKYECETSRLGHQSE